MSGSYDRWLLPKVFFLTASQLLVHTPGRATAQDDEEIILDPELADVASAPSAIDGEEVIADPELAEGRGPRRARVASSEPAYDPQANTGIARIEVVGQFQADVRHEGGLEDAYETRLRLDSEVDFRRSRKLRLSLGVRTDLFWALPALNDPDLVRPATPTTPAHRDRPIDQDRFELDILPLAASLDITVADGLHMRIGQQIVTLARLDFYSPIDILAVQDFRGQPKLETNSPKLAQPAVRIDWDLSYWATLQLVYVPWFMPHLSRSNRDRYVADVLGSSEEALPSVLDSLIDPSFQTKIPETGLRFIGPPPDFRTPQVMARLNMRGPGRELALSGGTALEKLPSMYSTPLAEQFLFGREGWQGKVAGAVTAGDPLIDIEYHRFYQVSLDGSFDIGPLTLGVEFAYSPARYLFYAAKPGGEALPQPNAREAIRDTVRDEQGNIVEPSNVTDESIRMGVPTVQGGLHIEYLRGTRFGLIFEGFWINALELPYDTERDWWGFIPGTGAFVGGLAGMMLRLDDGRWTTNAMAMALPGPSVIFLTQLELRASDTFYVNIGGQFYEGPAPTRHGGQDLNFGGLYSGYDQVFIGFRYVP